MISLSLQTPKQEKTVNNTFKVLKEKKLSIYNV